MMEDSLRNYVFVTVGTTSFDDLTKAVDDLDFHRLLQSQGYKGIVIQVGVSNYIPEHAVELSDANLADKKKFYAFYFNQRPSIEIEKFIKHADLVISHAGAGSITESLEKQKPVVVVVNDKLMNNHQKELADRLHEYVLSCYPSSLAHIVEAKVPTYKKERRTYKQADSKDFAEFLHQQFGRDSKVKKSKKSAPIEPVKTMIVLGSGGHTAEMFVELSNADKNLFTPRLYVMADSDARSEGNVNQFESTTKTKAHIVHKIPRSRKVGQSYITSIWTTFISFLYCFKLVWQNKPDLIVCNGPGTCVPIVFAAVILRALRISKTKLLFIESLARVEHLSLSGKILQYFVDWFIIQWPTLRGKVTKRADVHVHNFYFPL